MHEKSEVEIRVAQELKNNRDFIYETNQSIQTLNQGLASLCNLCEKVQAKSESHCKDISISFENFVEDVNQRYIKTEKRIDKFQEDAFLMIRNALSNLDYVTKQFNSFQRFKDQGVEFHSLVSKVLSDIANHLETQDVQLKTLTEKLTQEVKNARKDLAPKGISAEQVQKKIEEKLDLMKVDYQGMVKELSLLKKSDAYGQKKFENLYTLIERLKADK